jgi:hypothetical protein
VNGFTQEQLAAAGGWAFPCRHTPEHEPGMTLRDYFAANAPIEYAQACFIYGSQIPHDDEGRSAFYACWTMLRYEWADFMLAERERPGRRWP